jgi:phage recombination protein Bet
MTQEIIRQGNFAVTEDDMKTLEQAGVIPMNTPVPQLKVFSRVCQEHGLSPFRKEIHLVKHSSKHGDRYVAIVGIDGFRRKAARTGQLAGTDQPRYNVRSDGQFETAGDLITAKRLPDTCTVTVWKIVHGVRVAFTAEVVFNEFAKRYNGQLIEKWLTMPFQMIAKVAEAFAIRKGFADEVSGLFIEEEQGAFEGSNTGEIIDQDARKTAIEQITADLTHVNSKHELQVVWTRYRPWQKDEQIIELVKAKGRELEEIQVETEVI